MAAGAVPSSFWGPVTSTMDWCENNYARSPYVAELLNTLSNVPCVLLALIGLVNALRQRFERRFSALHVSNMILALGSMLFHATLRHVQQQSDETPMVWEVLLYLYVLYSPDWHYRSTMPIFLVVYGGFFAAVHALARFELAFKLHYAALLLLCIPRMYKYYIHTSDAAARRLAQLFVGTLLLGSLCWCADRFLCEQLARWPVNPQGHAWWHVCMGFNSYFANTFLMFCRAQQLGWRPRVERALGLLPYVRVDKPKPE